jgi:hypothetical protein
MCRRPLRLVECGGASPAGCCRRRRRR